LIYYLGFEGAILFNVFISSYFPIYVNSINIISLYFPSSVGLVMISFFHAIRNALSTRYGYHPSNT